MNLGRYNKAIVSPIIGINFERVRVAKQGTGLGSIRCRRVSDARGLTVTVAVSRLAVRHRRAGFGLHAARFGSPRVWSARSPGISEVTSVPRACLGDLGNNVSEMFMPLLDCLSERELS